MKNTFLQTLLALIVGAALLGIAVWAAFSPREQPIVLNPAPTAAPLLVHVAGAVEKPGVYQLPANSRFGDAIQAAGGLRQDAQAQLVNLAARLKDGEKVIIPVIGSQSTVIRNPENENNAPDPGGTTAIINLNTASLEELQTLPGIGQTRAEDIIAYREANNGFKSIEEIQNVSGIGPSTFEKLKDQVIVE